MKRLPPFRGQVGFVRERLAILAPLVVATGLMLWSGQRWVSTVRATTVLAQCVGHLESELGLVEQVQARVRQNATEARYTDLRLRLIAGEEGARAWLNHVTCVAAHYRFHLSLKVGAVERLPGEEPGVDLLPVDLEFHPEDTLEEDSPGSARFLTLLRDLETEQAPLQVVRLGMTGSAKGLGSASLSTRLWIHSPEP